MATREKAVVARHRTLFKALGIKVIKTSGEGEPDLVGSFEGFAFAIECKQEGKRPSPLQAVRLREWEASGAIAFMSDDPASSVLKLEDAVEKKKFDMWNNPPRKKRKGERKLLPIVPLTGVKRIR